MIVAPASSDCKCVLCDFGLQVNALHPDIEAQVIKAKALLLGARIEQAANIPQNTTDTNETSDSLIDQWENNVRKLEDYLAQSKPET